MVLAVTAGTATGNVNVERYIGVPAARRAWRLLTAPISGTQTIFNAWQNSGVYTVGIGTFITGPGGGNGLDAGNSSGKTYNVTTQALENLTSTNVPISPGIAASANNIGYFIFVRGDRNTSNLAIPNTNNTTLSATGNLQTGIQTFAASGTANNFTLIGNPYASPVNFALVTKNNLINRFYSWDPNLNTLGGYVLVDDANNTGTYSTVPNPPSPGSGSTAQTQHVQSGQAFFIQTAATAAASLVFNEANKSTSNINNVFRVSRSKGSLKANLFIQNTDNTTKLADGILVECNNVFSNDVNREDAYKFININENLSVYNKGFNLALERRKEFDKNDTLLLRLTNTTQRNYSFQLSAQDFNSAGLEAFLIDNYLKTNTPVDLSGAVTTANFTVTNDAASAAANRFYVLFGKPGLITNNKPASINIFPNPVQNGVINLQMNNMAKGVYTIRLVNASGVTEMSKQIYHEGENHTEIIKINKMPGIYMMEVIKPDNTKQTNKVIIN
jgi:hypothetical protein